MQKKTKDRLWLIAMAITMLLGFFVFGPLVDASINNMKPYFIVTGENLKEVSLAKTTKASCYVPIYKPVELEENVPTDTELYKVPMDTAPTDMMSYIHYPDNWNSWYNPFNPSGLGPKLYIVLSILNPILGFAVLVYAVILWRQGKFKGIIDKLRGKPNEKD